MRLSRQFRDDAHMATSANADEQSVTFVIEPTTIQYRIDGQTVSRLERKNDEDEIVSQELYGLDQYAAVHWDASRLPQWISLNVQRGGRQYQTAGSTDVSDDAIWDLAVRAGIGRHLENPADAISETRKLSTSFSPSLREGEIRSDDRTELASSRTSEGDGQ